MVEPDFIDPPTPTVGELPAVGDPLPEFELIGTDLRQITNETFACLLYTSDAADDVYQV